MEIVDSPKVTLCALPKETTPSADEYCNLVKTTVSCGLYNNLINFMMIFFCDLNLPYVSVFGLCSAIMLLGLFTLLHMMTKYFFFPNLVTLIEYSSTTEFGSAYLIFGPCLLMPYYTSHWESCAKHEENFSPLQFSKLIGDVMRYFFIGIMVLCVQGYRVEGVTLWSCITFLILGLLYLLLMINRKHYIYEKDIAAKNDLNLLEFRSLVFLFTLVVVLLVILAVSFSTFARRLPKKKKQDESFLHLESDDEILGGNPKQSIYSRKHIWLRTVNGNRIMRDSHAAYRFVMAPIFFVLAHFIPVISKDRFLIGWVKYINCLCFLALPVVCLFYKLGAGPILVSAIFCWSFAILVFISTHSMRPPDNIWLYSLLGLVISSMVMSVLSRVIENITWQYIGLQFDLLPDLNVLMYFGLGEMFSVAIVVKGLQRWKMWDASFGAAMSTTTYGLFLAFPLLYYHQCYNINCRIIATGSTVTCMLFLLLMLSTTLLHISMSGYEFRISLFIYLLGEILIYIAYQWMKHFNSVYPLTLLHNMD